MFKEVAFILAIATASLDVFGVTYCQGYLLELGVDDSQFPLTFDRALFQGFISIVNMGSKAILWIILAALSVTAAIFLFVVAEKWIKKYILKAPIVKAPNVSAAKAAPEPLDPNLKWSLLASIAAVGGLLTLLATLAFVIASTKAGEAAAKEWRKKAADGKLKEVVVEMKDPKKNFAGYSIICNPSQCAYLVSNESKTVNFADMNGQTVKLKWRQRAAH